MAIDKAGKWWTGTSSADLREYLTEFKAGGYEVIDVLEVPDCSACGNSVGYRVRIDDEEGYADRVCASCGHSHLMLDSADFVEDAAPEDAACPCGAEVFDVAVGFSTRDDGSIRWVSIGLRCRDDGVLGCYADWKIDYAPTEHLRTNL